MKANTPYYHDKRIIYGFLNDETWVFSYDGNNIRKLELKTLIVELWDELEYYWTTFKNIIIQKEFAIKINNCRLKHLIFVNKKQCGDLNSLYELFKNSYIMILQILKKSNNFKKYNS